LKYDGNLATLQLQKEEVSEVKWMKYTNFKREIMDPNANKMYVPATDEYWETIWRFFDKTIIMRTSQ
jgi:isopentenyldiphosphate isomerase